MYCSIYHYDFEKAGIPVCNHQSIYSSEMVDGMDVYYVGFFMPNGEFYIDKQCLSEVEARGFVNYLNGGEP